MDYSSLPGLEVSWESLDCCAVVTLRGEVDLDTAPLLESHVEVLTRKSEHLLFDCEKLRFIDSSGIHVLTRAHRAVNGSLGLVGLRAPVKRLFEIVGLTDEFLVFSSVGEAREYFHNGGKVRLTAGA
ncbi:MAG TPA: STAS domain-containing protein [Acidimicrobiia bacterium]|nr:STAS domain-containing protein [Acidimicrobiia bacterium]